MRNFREYLFFKDALNTKQKKVDQVVKLFRIDNKDIKEEIVKTKASQ